MKPRRLPLSALITGLLAAPGMGIVPPPTGLDARVPTVQAFPAEMPGAVAAEMRRVARGEPLNAYGMQGLQRRMALRVQDHLATVLAQEARMGGMESADSNGGGKGGSQAQGASGGR
jgi:hypothetical protein